MSDIKAGTILGGGVMAAWPERAQPMLDMVLTEQQAAGGMSVTIERGERFVLHRGVAIVPVRGLLNPNAFMLERWLGWTTYQGLEDTMAFLAASEDVAAIIPVFDTPGGFVLGLQGAAQAIAAAAKVKPVHGIVHPLAASAGYWLASQCRDIVLTPGSEVGSVGVVTGLSTPQETGMDGWRDFVMTSAHAGAKRPDPATERGAAMVQAELDALEADFLAAVAAGRGIAIEDLPEVMSRSGDPAEGAAVFWGAEAQRRGLVDTLETYADAMARLTAAYAPKPRKSARARAAQVEAAQAVSES